MASTVIAPAARRHENPVLGDVATILETAAETGGDRTVIEVEVAPGGGTHPHVHRAFAEHVLALEGVVTIETDGKRQVLVPGDVATAPAGSVHCFRNESADAITIRVELRPGHSGFEESLAIACGLARDGLANADGTPRNLVHTALLVGLSGTAVAGPMRAAEPVLRVLAAVARRRGALEPLRRRYVTG